MVVQVQWIEGLFHLMLLLQAAAAETKQLVREGDKTMLTCGNLNENQAKCEATTWTFTDSGTRTTLELVTLGRVRQPRISLSEDCSLLIPEVRAEDAGVYFCQQFISGVKKLPDALVYLSVVTLTTQVDVDYVSLTCCVLTYNTCPHEVRWLFNNVKMENAPGLILTFQNSCTATVKTLTSHECWRRNALLTCEVQYDQMVKTFPFRAPGVAPAETTSTTVSTRTAEDSATLPDFWWFFVIIAAIFVVFLVVVVIVVKKKQTKAVEKICNDEQNTHSAVTHSTPEISQDKREAEDSVSYAAIIIRSQPKAQGQRQNGDGGEVVYSTLKDVPSDPSI